MYRYMRTLGLVLQLKARSSVGLSGSFSTDLSNFPKDQTHAREREEGKAETQKLEVETVADLSLYRHHY